MKSNQKLFIWTGVVLIILTMVALFFLRYDSDAADGETHGANCIPFKEEVSHEDGERIQHIIYTLSHTSVFGLAFKKGDLEATGKKLDGSVPALEFLAYIFSRPEMVKDMATIKTSSMKYDNFVKGLQTNLMEDYNTGCLYYRAKKFSKYLNLNVEQTDQILHQCVNDAVAHGNQQAFKPFVNYLIKKKMPKKT